MMHKTQDELFMQRAFDLAALGAGKVAPNPLVGAVIVHEGNIIGEGWHDYYGGPHAEVHAVRSVKAPLLLPHSTLYCTLEPCFHVGKTPPCVELILAHNIKRVVVAVPDINPLVAGKSIAKLKDMGIEVQVGVLAEQFLPQNKVFIHWMTHQAQQPYIILKWAQSRDGFIGKKGERVAISDPVTRRLVHRWRSECDAILVGTQTALADNPQLDTRYYTGKNPLRIVIDFEGKMPLTHALLDDSTPTWVIGKTRLGNWQYTIFQAFSRENLLNELSTALAQDKKASLLVEGGAELIQSYLDFGLFQEIRMIENEQIMKDGIHAPKLQQGLPMVKEEWIGKDKIQFYEKGSIIK
jgi:diaminohydroxyphosphoribosylaminopyrimidine deaminase/5-amino-6-(5-phosphoribosylamino)uracil reductase